MMFLSYTSLSLIDRIVPTTLQQEFRARQRNTKVYGKHAFKETTPLNRETTPELPKKIL